MITILTAGIAATSTMTLFSYLVALLFRQPYKEPLLLAFLIQQLHLKTSGLSRLIAWMLHYAIGIGFVVGYDFMFRKGWISAGFQDGLLFGAAIGLIGILGWTIMFKLSKKRPEMNYTGYYIQLLAAHVVFGLTVIRVYELWSY